jgi:hypothetical protein
MKDSGEDSINGEFSEIRISKSYLERKENISGNNQKNRMESLKCKYCGNIGNFDVINGKCFNCNNFVEQAGKEKKDNPLKLFNFFPIFEENYKRKKQTKKENMNNEIKKKEKMENIETNNIKQTFEKEDSQNNENLQVQKRRDRNGNPIIKGCKGHSVTFIDEIEKNDSSTHLVDFVEIESYKKYNTFPDTIDGRDPCVCNCFIY